MQLRTEPPPDVGEAFSAALAAGSPGSGARRRRYNDRNCWSDRTASGYGDRASAVSNARSSAVQGCTRGLCARWLLTLDFRCKPSGFRSLPVNGLPACCGRHCATINALSVPDTSRTGRSQSLCGVTPTGRAIMTRTLDVRVFTGRRSDPKMRWIAPADRPGTWEPEDAIP